MTKVNKTYLVDLNKLQIGDNLFSYVVDNSFFEQYSFGEIQAGDFEVDINIIKSTARLHLHITLSGYATATCDKCVADIELKLQNTFTYTIRTVNKDELTEDLLADAEFITISKDEMELDVSTIIYENTHLLLPVQRIGCTDRNGVKRCDQSVLAHLTEVESTQVIDPRWAELLKLKNKQSNNNN